MSENLVVSTGGAATSLFKLGPGLPPSAPGLGCGRVAGCLPWLQGNPLAAPQLAVLAADSWLGITPTPQASIATIPQSAIALTPRASHPAGVERSASVGPTDIPPTPAAPGGPRDSRGAQSGAAPLGGGFSVNTLALMMLLVGIPALFYESFLLSVAHWRSAAGARLERPG